MEKVMAGNLIRFRPFGNLGSLEPLRNLDELFNSIRMGNPLSSIEAEPHIKIDVYETDNAYTVKADAPGVSKEDIQVHIEGNQVSIQVEIKKETSEKEEGKVVRSERYVGQQYRSFSLEHDIDEAGAEAQYADGVLELTLPKKQGAKKKTLKIK